MHYAPAGAQANNRRNSASFPSAKESLVFGAFTLVNALFCIASSLKLMEGGYIPLCIGLALFAVMLTWRWGRRATFAAYKAKHTMTMRKLVEFHKSERAYMERIGLLMTPKRLTSLNDMTGSAGTGKRGLSAGDRL